ncbi:MAG TPA: CRISPR-associated endonuclease Cas1 [Nitrososphaera sp.]|jgi:CRISPR-associated protein Cas1
MQKQNSTQVQEPQEQVLISGESYAASQARYAEKVTRKEETHIVLSGFNVSLRVEKNQLLIKAGKDVRTLYPGIHGVSHIFIITDNGYQTFDALDWCKAEHIGVSVLDYQGNLKYTFVAETSNGKLHRKQAQVAPSKIAYQLVYRKALEQLTLLQSRALVTGEWCGKSDQQRACDIFETAIEWLKLPELPRWQDVDDIRQFEARLAKAYWFVFEQVTLSWAKSESKTIPAHWKQAGTRSTDITRKKNHGARSASSPFHAILNYAYACLASQVRLSLVKAGFDTSCGFLHVDKEGRDSLTYDLMELYRSQVDALVLKLIEKTTFRKGDFLPVSDGSVRLSPNLAKFVILSCSLAQEDIDQGTKWLKELVLSAENVNQEGTTSTKAKRSKKAA